MARTASMHVGTYLSFATEPVDGKPLPASGALTASSASHTLVPSFHVVCCSVLSAIFIALLCIVVGVVFVLCRCCVVLSFFVVCVECCVFCVFALYVYCVFYLCIPHFVSLTFMIHTYS